jgi:hypothetical protein
MTTLNFPNNPIVGTVYEGPNNTLYVYDGEKWNVQGTTVTASSSVNFVQDSVAPLFTNIQGHGITFSYNDQTNTLTANVTGYSGSVAGNGYTGSAGTNGYTGSAGTNGYTGSSGASAAVGYTGSKGYDGSVGYTGSAGANGTSVKIVGTMNGGNPAYDLSVGFPTPNAGDGVIDEITGNLWVYDGRSWSNVGQIKGDQGNIGYTGSTGINVRGSWVLGSYYPGDIVTHNGVTYLCIATWSYYDPSYGYPNGSWQIISGPAGTVGYTGSNGGIGYTGSVGYQGYTGSRGVTNEIVSGDFTVSLSSITGILSIPTGISFPDTTYQSTAWTGSNPIDYANIVNVPILPEVDIDGGHALAYFNVPSSADGGGSSQRFGPNSPTINGDGANGTYTNTLDGGGA